MGAIDVTSEVGRKTEDLLSRPSEDAWAACAAVWTRTLVLAAPGWAKWPTWFDHVHRAHAEAIRLVAGAGRATRLDEQLLVLEGFDIEDDGSTEWQYVVDSIAMLLPVLHQEPLAVCLQTALTTYLDGKFNVLSNLHALSLGRPISDVEARHALEDDRAWLRAVNFVRSL